MAGRTRTVKSASRLELPPSSASALNRAPCAFLLSDRQSRGTTCNISGSGVIRPSAKEFFTKGSVSVTQSFLLPLNRKLMPREPNPSPDSSPQSPIRAFSYSLARSRCTSRPLLHPHPDRTPRLNRDHLHGLHFLIRLERQLITFRHHSQNQPCLHHRESIANTNPRASAKR